MSSAATSAGTPLHRRAQLRLVHDAGVEHAGQGRGENESAAQPTAACGHATQVLVAGANASIRSRMLGELRGLLPDGTRFVEAHETWEVIASAAASRMVVLTGDLGDVSAESLLRLLARRHPTLPVLAVDGHTPVPARADVDVATV